MKPNQVIDLVKELCDKANVPFIESNFNLKGNWAGCFRPSTVKGDCTLDFNEVLMQENPDDFRTTVIHEVAHWVRWVRAGYAQDMRKGGSRDVHGVKWKNVMKELGIEDPKTYHTFNTDSVVKKQRRWAYQCDCTTHEVATVTHNRIQNGEKEYSCNSCGKDIQYSGYQIKNIS